MTDYLRKNVQQQQQPKRIQNVPQKPQNLQQKKPRKQLDVERTLETMFMPIASPVKAVNLRCNERATCFTWRFSTRANLQYQRQLPQLNIFITITNEKAQLSLTNPRDPKACQNCSNWTCLQRCRWQYRPIFIRLAVVESEICEITQNSLKIQTYGVQGHPRLSILVSIESPCTTSY